LRGGDVVLGWVGFGVGLGGVGWGEWDEGCRFVRVCGRGGVVVCRVGEGMGLVFGVCVEVVCVGWQCA
jgi:hypothetical protein